MSEHEKVLKEGQWLTRRVWDLVSHAGDAVGARLYVVQGGYRAQHGGGASASAGTHDAGDVLDISVGNLSRSQALGVVAFLREHYGVAWLRSPEFGWPESAGGPHIHCVMADSHDPLSPGARQQVDDYDVGRNGLASGTRDPHPRPSRRTHWALEDDVTPEQLDAAIERVVRRLMPEIAKSVWHFMLEDQAAPKDEQGSAPKVYAATILRRIRSNAAWLVKREQE